MAPKAKAKMCARRRLPPRSRADGRPAIVVQPDDDGDDEAESAPAAAAQEDCSVSALDCPMCYNTFVAAVMIVVCGRSFCRACLETDRVHHWLKVDEERRKMNLYPVSKHAEAGLGPGCPECRAQYRTSDMVQNIQLRRTVDEWAENGGGSALKEELRLMSAKLAEGLRESQMFQNVNLKLYQSLEAKDLVIATLRSKLEFLGKKAELFAPRAAAAPPCSGTAASAGRLGTLQRLAPKRPRTELVQSGRTPDLDDLMNMESGDEDDDGDSSFAGVLATARRTTTTVFTRRVVEACPADRGAIAISRKNYGGSCSLADARRAERTTGALAMGGTSHMRGCGSWPAGSSTDTHAPGLTTLSAAAAGPATQSPGDHRKDQATLLYVSMVHCVCAGRLFQN